MQKLLKLIIAVSASLANTVLASLAWSGATRFVNTFGTGHPDTNVFLFLASLASRVTVVELRPTSDGVLTLLLTEPVMQKPDPIAIAALEKAGEDITSVITTLAEEHNIAIARFDKLKARITTNKKAIIKELDKALALEQAAFVKLPETLEAALVSKIWDKVKSRRARLIVDITSRTRVDDACIELTEINALIESQKATKKAA